MKVSELVCAPILGIAAQRRAGGAQGAHLAQFATGAQVQPGFLAIGTKGRAGADRKERGAEYE
jgi:hypothetical protein